MKIHVNFSKFQLDSHKKNHEKICQIATAQSSLEISGFLREINLKDFKGPNHF